VSGLTPLYMQSCSEEAHEEQPYLKLGDLLAQLYSPKIMSLPQGIHLQGVPVKTQMHTIRQRTHTRFNSDKNLPARCVGTNRHDQSYVPCTQLEALTASNHLHWFLKSCLDSQIIFWRNFST